MAKTIPPLRGVVVFTHTAAATPDNAQVVLHYQMYSVGRIKHYSDLFTVSCCKYKTKKRMQTVRHTKNS